MIILVPVCFTFGWGGSLVGSSPLAALVYEKLPDQNGL